MDPMPVIRFLELDILDRTSYFEWDLYENNGDRN
jgi:hypothetical protein